jgi:hypothetical protein
MHPTALSSYHEGFGPTVSMSSNHKFFEYKLDFSEIDINFDDVLADPEPLFQARMSVEAVSVLPSFSVYYPSHYSFFSTPMIKIALDIGTVSVDPGAPIIAGIGLVPRTFINQTTGLATTGTGHQINVTDAPFGSHLRVIGNVNKLPGLGIQYYAVGYCNMDVSACNGINSGAFDLAEWQFVGDARTNYYWDGMQGKYILDSVSPETILDGAGYLIKVYPILSTSLDWYFPNLLFDWRTTGTVAVNSGLYKIHFFGFADKNLLTFVNTPDSESTMVVRIDNTWPVLAVNSISYKGSEVAPCAIIRLDDADDELSFNISAYDPDGFLYNFSLHALYGDNQSFTCHAEDYASFLADGGTGPVWAPAFPSGNYVCQGDAGDHWETTCGYTFRVSGWDRAINGYGRIHWNSGHKTITILMPNDPICR